MLWGDRPSRNNWKGGSLIDDLDSVVDPNPNVIPLPSQTDKLSRCAMSSLYFFQCIRQSPIKGLHRTCALMSHLCRTRQPTNDEICMTQDALCTHPSCAHYLKGVFSQYDLNGYLRPLPLQQVVQLLEEQVVQLLEEQLHNTAQLEEQLHNTRQRTTKFSCSLFLFRSKRVAVRIDS